MSNTKVGITSAIHNNVEIAHLATEVKDQIVEGIEEGDVGKVGGGVFAGGVIAIMSSAQIGTVITSVAGAAAGTTVATALIPIGLFAGAIGLGMMAWKKLRG